MQVTIFAVPFAMTSEQQEAWLLHAGGRALWGKIISQFGIILLPAGRTLAQSFGSFKKATNTPEDFQGLKIRMPGLGGQMAKKLGATPVPLPVSEIFAALQQAAVDAAEAIGPVNDLTQKARWSRHRGTSGPA